MKHTQGSSYVALTSKEGNDALINASGQLHVVMRGKYDTGNSIGNGTNLIADQVFTGTPIDILDYAAVGIQVHSDVAGHVSMQFSPDNIEWREAESADILAGADKWFTPTKQGSYFKIVYTNGAVGTSDFGLHTTLSKTPIKWSSHNIKDPIVDEDDAELVLNVNTGKDPNGIYRNVNVTVDGDMLIADNSSGLAIAEGLVTKKSFIHKFGLAPNIATADLAVVWDGANNSLFGGSPPMLYTYSATADIGTISSSNNSDTGVIEVLGLASNYTIVTQNVILTGQTDALLGTNLIRVVRMRNIGATDLLGVVYLRTNGSGQSVGVPTTANTVRAIINNGNNQTLMSVYTIPDGYTGYMRDWYASTAGANKTSNYILKLRVRPFGQVFQLKHISAVADSGTSSYKHEYIEPEIFSAKTDIEITTQPQAVGVTGASIAAGFDIVLVQD